MVGETLRIGIDRLDHLMNLTGELVVANARFCRSPRDESDLSQAGRVQEVEGFDAKASPAVRLGSRASRRGNPQMRTVGAKSLTGSMTNSTGSTVNRPCGARATNAFPRLRKPSISSTRVSKNLQRDVLNTRMVPIGPLFNRFKRVVRDLSVERGKQVQLEIRGEKTELDKRMIDALGDPLLHLVRNSIDHGIESPEDRRMASKPEAGTIVSRRLTAGTTC